MKINFEAFERLQNRILTLENEVIKLRGQIKEVDQKHCQHKWRALSYDEIKQRMWIDINHDILCPYTSYIMKVCKDCDLEKRISEIEHAELLLDNAKEHVEAMKENLTEFVVKENVVSDEKAQEKQHQACDHDWEALSFDEMKRCEAEDLAQRHMKIRTWLYYVRKKCKKCDIQQHISEREHAELLLESAKKQVEKMRIYLAKSIAKDIAKEQGEL